MKKITKYITALILALSVIFVPVNIQGTGLVSSAATFAQLNAGNVFLKQNTSVTCTLASAAMILRRTAIAAGYNDWEQITEENIRNVGWVDGIGLLWNFSCYNMTIGHGYFSGTDNKMSMIDLLEKYPQGVVIYNGGNSGQSHAVVLTDYDEKSDTFYAADPASSAPSGRIKLTESTIKGETQDEQIDNLTSYWYVSSPEVTYKDGNYSSGGNVGGSTEGSDGQSFYDPTSDTAVFKTTQKDVNEYYVVSDDSSQGAALRHYPSGSSSSVKSLEKGTLIYVSYEGKNNYIINASDIVFLEKDERKVLIHTTTDDLVSARNMQFWSDTLKDKCFYRCNRAYIINMNYVDSFTTDFVYLSRNKRKEKVYLTLKKFNNFKHSRY